MRKLQIQVLTRDGRKTIYETDRSRNVGDLKKYIGRCLNVPMSFSRLVYKGRLLSNNCILEDEGVKRMSTLDLFWQPLVLTPKKYREKELELDKLEQKQRHLSRMEHFEQLQLNAAKKAAAIHERSISSARSIKEQVSVGVGPDVSVEMKRSLSVDNLQVAASSSVVVPKLPPCPEPTKEEKSSEDDVDFMSNYWCCPQNIQLIGPKSESLTPAVAFKFNFMSSVNECRKDKIPIDKDFDELLLLQRQQHGHGHGHGGSKQRTSLRLTAGQMCRSVVPNLKKYRKSPKK
ncbi:CG12725 [Drosophila busckii]|uniref:CG12725 n=1 Tax=Drosophila busckii TaxID=30019 RepID=A0A0M5J376_DROBS|nr:uncharacterized protein LOC108605899 [Drosophila busckii]ALC49311.1 CG12725 [Drosophila busckii]